MEFQWPCFLDFEVVLILQGVNEGLRLFKCKGKIINIYSNVLISLSNSPHPYVWLGSARGKSFFSKDVAQLIMPTCSTGSQSIQCFVDKEGMTCQWSKFRSCTDANSLRCSCL